MLLHFKEYGDNGSQLDFFFIFKNKETRILKLVSLCAGAILGFFLLVLVVIALYCVYSSDKIEKGNQLKIEKFLEDYRALKPSRYSYADIKKITNQL